MAKLIEAYETINHREVNGWTVTLFRNVSHNGTQPHGSYSASVRENATENVLSFYGETREAVEREVLRIVGVSPLDAAALVEENTALRAENERLRAEAKRADEEATALANSDLATTEQVVRALRVERNTLLEALDMLFCESTNPKNIEIVKSADSAARLRIVLPLDVTNKVRSALALLRREQP